MNFNAFIYLLLTFIQLCYSKLSDQCIKSNTFWYSLKYSYNDILKLKTTQSTTVSCLAPLSPNCCSSEMNKDMTSVSELRLKGFAEERIENVLMMLTNDSYDLMNIYLQDLENTKIDLNTLFSTTYGYNYKVHRDFFFQFFNNLKLYMQGKLNNIDKIVDTFFHDLAQRIVRILIAPNSTPDMISCHLARLIETKPYQDTDVALKSKINRSYPPARLLVNGIAVGRDVFHELFKNLSPTSKCVQQFNTAFHCMLCQGLTLKPCLQSCNAIIDSCFGSFKSSDTKKLDRVLTKYTKSLLQLAAKLDNPFNFPEVNNKMNVQISSAIMGVQNMYPNKKEEIRLKCQGSGGSLAISRRKRQASQEFYNWQNSKNNNNKKQWWEQTQSKNINEDNKEKKDFNNDQTKPVESLSTFARKMKQKYKSLESYFKNQKEDICSSMKMSDVSLDCWNGTAVTKNSAPILMKEAKKKGEKVDDPTIKSAIMQLNDITKRINSYISGSNSDPDTVSVQEYKLYTSPKIKKTIDQPIDQQQPIFNSKSEGSGELEDSKFLQPKVRPEVIKKEPPPSNPNPPQVPEKGTLELPTFPEGSGDNDNKFPDEPIKKTPKLPSKKKPVISSSTATSSVSATTVKNIMSTKPSTTSPNQIPDDEDLNPPSPENIDKSKINVPQATIPPIVQPEGSGNQPGIPESGPNNPIPPTILTTTQPPGPPIDGSGDDTKPNLPTPKPAPVLPMLPETPKAVTNPPPKTKPDSNPDEDILPVEGSGRSVGPTPSQKVPPTDPIESFVNPPEPLKPTPELTPPKQVTQSTKPPVETPPPSPYPGNVPPEVWIPNLKGANNQENANQRSTPSGSAHKLFDRRMIICQTMLIVAATLATA